MRGSSCVPVVATLRMVNVLNKRLRALFAIVAFNALFAVSSPGASAARATVPAFPGAEGAGAVTGGGRGGRVIFVTSLADSGPGSFRAALEAGGPRIVVFEVSGIITLQSKLTVSHPFLTIAGQTAPGEGICIRGHTVELNASDIIIRYLRFRRGNLTDRDDALNARSSPGRIIIDHCSFSWGLDENVSIYRYMRPLPDGKESKQPIEQVTIQWSISSEALNTFRHAFGATWGGRHASFHHNLFASNTARNPSIGWGDHVDFRNNVIFNWGHRTVDGGDATSLVNIVSNYYKAGPATQPGPGRDRIAKPEAFRNFHEREQPGQWYVAGNLVHHNPQLSADNWSGGVQFEGDDEGRVQQLLAEGRKAQPAAVAAVATDPAPLAYERVLKDAGATRPRRDAVDERIVQEVATGRPTFGNGIINSPEEVGGYPEYRSLPPPVDSDRDGMSDAWERRYDLNTGDPADGPRDPDKDGYTNVEEFLNGTSPREFVDYSVPENNRTML
jgi:pectate lyase